MSRAFKKIMERSALTDKRDAHLPLPHHRVYALPHTYYTYIHIGVQSASRYGGILWLLLAWINTISMDAPKGTLARASTSPSLSCASQPFLQPPGSTPAPARSRIFSSLCAAFYNHWPVFNARFFPFDESLPALHFSALQWLALGDVSFLRVRFVNCSGTVCIFIFFLRVCVQFVD